jgi:hypothetical protein
MMDRGETEEEIAGQVAHRLYHHGAEALNISVAADGRGRKYRRAGFTPDRATSSCVLQTTATRDGLFATASRTVCFGAPDPAFKAEFDLACRFAAVYRAAGQPGTTISTAGEAGRPLAVGGPYEFDWRESQPGYGTGWLPAEEMRRTGQEEPLIEHQAVVWQARVGAAAVVDTVLIAEASPIAVTPTEDWPFKRFTLGGLAIDVPDLLIRET